MPPPSINSSSPSCSIDFFSELSKIVNSKNNSTNLNASNTSNSSKTDINNIIINNDNTNSNVIHDNDSNDNICLISKEKLHPNHITLSCNHKFNYIPIYKEVHYQKNKSNIQYEVTKLQYNQIKCPYCRTITNNLLPYIQYPSIYFSKLIHALEPHCIRAIKCEHFIKHRDKNIEDTRCNKNALFYENENVLFCPTHYRLYSSNKNKKSSKSNNVSKNSIISKNTINKSNKLVNNGKCCAILKSGTNTGKPCNCTITIDNSQYCKRHSNIYSS